MSKHEFIRIHMAYNDVSIRSSFPFKTDFIVSLIAMGWGKGKGKGGRKGGKDKEDRPEESQAKGSKGDEGAGELEKRTDVREMPAESKDPGKNKRDPPSSKDSTTPKAAKAINATR